MQRSLCSVSGGISNTLFTKSCSYTIRRSIRMGTATSRRNCTKNFQEKKLEVANRKCVVFYKGNAKPRVFLVIRRKLPHPSYQTMRHPTSTLFLQNSMNGKLFCDLDAVKKYLDDFFTLKPTQFYAGGILKLLERWVKVVGKNGKYFDEYLFHFPIRKR